MPPAWDGGALPLSYLSSRFYPIRHLSPRLGLWGRGVPEQSEVPYFALKRHYF